MKQTFTIHYLIHLLIFPFSQTVKLFPKPVQFIAEKKTQLKTQSKHTHLTLILSSFCQVKLFIGRKPEFYRYPREENRDMIYQKWHPWVIMCLIKTHLNRFYIFISTLFPSQRPVRKSWESLLTRKRPFSMPFQHKTPLIYQEDEPTCSQWRFIVFISL